MFIFNNAQIPPQIAFLNSQVMVAPVDSEILGLRTTKVKCPSIFQKLAYDSLYLHLLKGWVKMQILIQVLDLLGHTFLHGTR